MKKISLVIMAAGIGSRYGSGIKQLEPVGMHDEIFMDYSIHDAIEAGFDRIVVIIRKDIEADFRERIGDRIEGLCTRQGIEFTYTYQELDEISGKVPEGRSKPWGTGQAVLVAKELLDGPFAVVNADDYYGKESFRLIYNHLYNCPEDSYCMIGFVLKNTLSEHGSVTRGICEVDSNNMLINVVETRNIRKTETGAESDGAKLNPESIVSMNMWGLTPGFLTLLEEGFNRFFEKDVPLDPLKAEYLLPIIIGELLREKQISVKMLETNSKWFGITYKEDKASVIENFRHLIEDGIYPAELYSDVIV